MFFKKKKDILKLLSDVNITLQIAKMLNKYHRTS